MENPKYQLDLDIAVAKGQLAVMRARQDDFARAIKQLQDTRMAVDEEVFVLEERIKTLEAQKIPIHRLPNEILLELLAAFVFDSSSNCEQAKYYTPPVVASQVCRRWRELCLAEPKFWSYISLCGSTMSVRALKAFFQRSTQSPVDILFSPPRHIRRGTDVSIKKLVDYASPHFSRCRSLVFHCPSSGDLEPLFAQFTNSFPILESLELSVTSMDPLHIWLWDHRPPHLDSKPKIRKSRLAHVRIEQLPLFNRASECIFPETFFSTITSLELCFPPHLDESVTPHSLQYFLSMGHLRRVLLSTTKLQNLTLDATTVEFDVRPIVDADMFDPSLPKVQPVRLASLKKFEWRNYPSSKDARRIMSLLDCPELVSMDWFFDVTASESIEGYRSTTLMLEFPLLRELYVQSADPNIVNSTFRSFSFPHLEKLELAYAGSQDDEVTVVPRLDDLLRDPRLPQLTHLTLSRLVIDTPRARAMLGYMPALTYLSLDGCDGVESILRSLSQYAVSTYTGDRRDGQVGSSGVKYCPCLDTLVLWACADIEFGAIRATVTARNMPRGKSQQFGEVEVAQGSTGREGKTVEDQKGREIRPLRRTLRHAADTLVSPAAAGSLGHSPVLPAARSPQPITRVRIEACPLVSQEEALMLRQLGVVDVVWKGAKTKFATM